MSRRSQRVVLAVVTMLFCVGTPTIVAKAQPAAAASPPTPYMPANLVSDPGFETSTQVPTYVTGSTVKLQATAPVHNGSYSLAQTVTATSGEFAVDNNSLWYAHATPGQTYQVSIWVYTAATSQSTVQLAADVLNSSNGYLSYLGSSADAVLTPGAWTLLQFYGTVPANGASVAIQGDFFGATAGTVLYWDDMSVSGPVAAGAAAHFVNCSLSTAGNGTMSSPWNSLSQVDSAAALPAGSMLLLAAGSQCNGSLQPAGSGTAAAPITVASYGSGPLPIVNAGTSNVPGVQLLYQSYWSIIGLTVSGGTSSGLYVGDYEGTQSFSGIYLNDVIVHGVTESANQTGALIDISSDDLNDATVNDVLAYGGSGNVTGIELDVGAGEQQNGTNYGLLGDDATIENSLVHDVGSTGITILAANGALTTDNVSYNTGSTSGSTSNWDFNCENCYVTHNAAFNSSGPPGSDGGDFDIDYASENQTVSNNFGGPSSGYCASIFSSSGYTELNSTITANTCYDNGDVASFSNSGAIYFSSFDQSNGNTTAGCINGATITNNTIFWSPAATGGPPSDAALQTEAYQGGQAVFCGSDPDIFQHNTIYANPPNFVTTDSPLSLDYNSYQWPTTGQPTWSYNGPVYGETQYHTFASYQSGAGQDAHSTATSGTATPTVQWVAYVQTQIGVTVPCTFVGDPGPGWCSALDTAVGQ